MMSMEIESEFRSQPLRVYHGPTPVDAEPDIIRRDLEDTMRRDAARKGITIVTPIMYERREYPEGAYHRCIAIGVKT